MPTIEIKRNNKLHFFEVRIERAFDKWNFIDGMAYKKSNAALDAEGYFAR
jgi:hypothetical protein